MGTLEKLNALENRESYIVDTVIDIIDNDTKAISRDNVCDELTKNYLQKKANVDISIDVESYDLILDLLYNIKQAKDENLLLISANEQDKMMTKAEQLFLNCRFDESIKLLNALAENDNPKAMYLLGEIYCWGLPENKTNREMSDFWRKKGAAHNDILCQLNLAYTSEMDNKQEETIISNILNQIIDLANAGDMYAQEELGSLYIDRKNEEKAIEFYHLAAAQGFFKAFCDLGDIYYTKENYLEAAHWYELAGEAGYDWGWRNLATLYDNGLGVYEDKDKAVYYYEKACALEGEATSDAAFQLGSLYENDGKYNAAKKWYRISANAGNIDAQNALNSLTLVEQMQRLLQ